MPFPCVWQSVPVNKSKRPFLAENEHHVFVKDGVGIYQGKVKIKHFQDGRVYLTNKRVIYLDSADLSRAVAVELGDVATAESKDKFLRSSPKVKIFLRIASGSTNREGDPECDPENTGETALNPLAIVDWVCGICSFNNHLSTRINLASNFPKCVSCGVPPSQEQVESVLKRYSMQSRDSASSQGTHSGPDLCPKCTFINHPSMRFCEVCEAPLKQASNSLLNRIKDSELKASPASSNPLGLMLEDAETYTNSAPYVKISFRKGGDADFYKHLRALIDKMKWEALEAKGGVSDDSAKVVPSREPTPRIQSRGIQGLVRIGEFQRKQNELILSLSLEDLEQLMHKAQEILEVTSSFSSLIKKSQLPHTTMSPLLVGLLLSVYLQELAQHMCEYLLSFELTRATSMVTTQDLFASYNRFSVLSQGFGGELVTTQNFQKCLQLFSTLNLPVKLKTFQSGLVVVTQRLHDLQDIHRVIMEYLVAEENRFMYEKFSSELLADTDGYMRGVYRTFCGKTVSEIADHFGWSSTICVEELARCMEEGLLVCDKHVLGTFYFLNKFDLDLAQKIKQESLVRERAQQDVFSQQKQITSELKLQQESAQNLLTFNDFDFGALSGFQDDNKSEESVPLNGPVSESLSLLSGLKF